MIQTVPFEVLPVANIKTAVFWDVIVLYDRHTNILGDLLPLPSKYTLIT
jgi:hypothetical protein